MAQTLPEWVRKHRVDCNEERSHDNDELPELTYEMVARANVNWGLLTL